MWSMEDEKELVSVVIPTYNRESTILRAVKSVLGQSHFFVEVIVVDDGSTDATKDIINQIPDSRIKYIYQNNSGAQVARNNGIKNAKGKYICFLDSDDYWEKEKLERQIHFLKETSSDIVFAKFDKIFSDGTHMIGPEISTRVDISREELGARFLVTTGTILGKSNVIKATPFDENVSRFQDYDYLLMLSKKNKVSFLDRVILRQFDSSDSITAAVTCEKVEKNIRYLCQKYTDISTVKPFLLRVLLGTRLTANENCTDVCKELWHEDKNFLTGLWFCLEKIGLIQSCFELNTFLKKQKLFSQIHFSQKKCVGGNI